MKKLCWLLLLYYLLASTDAVFAGETVGEKRARLSAEISKLQKQQDESSELARKLSSGDDPVVERQIEAIKESGVSVRSPEFQARVNNLRKPRRLELDAANAETRRLSERISQLRKEEYALGTEVDRAGSSASSPTPGATFAPASVGGPGPVSPNARVPGASSGAFVNAGNEKTSYTNEPQQLDSMRIKRETSEKKMEMTSSEVSTLKHKQRLAEEAIKRINDGVDHALEGIPKMVPTGKRGELEENEEYTQAEKNLRAEADKKIEVIRRELQVYRERLKAETASAKSAVDLHESNLQSQLNAGTGTSRLTPQGTGMYVRNYVNFGQQAGEKILLRKDTPEPLRGKMEKISAPPKPTSGK